MTSHEADPVTPIAGGNDAAALICEHWTAIYRLLFSLTGNTHDTEDLTQDTFVRAIDRIGSFRPGTKMRAWLLRIATNAFFDFQRRRKIIRIHPLAAEPVAGDEGPGHKLEIAEQGRLLQIALEELSETTRLVFHLRAAEELSFREIADMVGTTEDAARWHMHQARLKLIKRMKDV